MNHAIGTMKLPTSMKSQALRSVCEGPGAAGQRELPQPGPAPHRDVRAVHAWQCLCESGIPQPREIYVGGPGVSRVPTRRFPDRPDPDEKTVCFVPTKLVPCYRIDRRTSVAVFVRNRVRRQGSKGALHVCFTRLHPLAAVVTGAGHHSVYSLTSRRPVPRSVGPRGRGPSSGWLN